MKFTGRAELQIKGKMFIIQVLQGALESGSPDCTFAPQAFQESVFINLITGELPTVHPEQQVRPSYPKHILLPFLFLGISR